MWATGDDTRHALMNFDEEILPRVSAIFNIHHSVSLARRRGVEARAMLTIANDNFYVDDDALKNTPSRADGVSEDVEFAQRAHGCELVLRASILLKTTQSVGCTAQVLLHRFYTKKSLAVFDVERVAMATVFLACKLEENNRKLRDVVNVFHRMKQRRRRRDDAAAENADDDASLDHLEYFSQKYEDVKQDVIRVERHVLRAFGFCIHVEHPHKFVVNYARMMEQPKELMRRAWAFANDSLRTNLCVRFRADAVAVACVFLAARTLGMPMPRYPPWHDVFDVSAEDAEVMSASILALYVAFPGGGGGKGGGGGRTAYERLVKQPPPGSSPPPPPPPPPPPQAPKKREEDEGDGGGRGRKRSRERSRERERSRSRDRDRSPRRERRRRSRERDRSRERERSRDRGRDRRRDDGRGGGRARSRDRRGGRYGKSDERFGTKNLQKIFVLKTDDLFFSFARPH